MKNRLIILDGPTSAGKSSLASALQELLLPEIWLSFSNDNIIYTLPGSVLGRCNNASDWSGIDTHALFAGAFACLKALLSSNNRVIFDLVGTSAKQANQLATLFNDYPPITFAVSCEWREIERRTIARGDRALQEAEYSFKHSPRHLAYDAVIDTTEIDSQAAALQCMQVLKATLD